MSFWSTSTGEDLTKTEAPKEYDAGGGYITIPDGSTVLAFIKEVKWATGRDEDGSPRYISIQWMVEEPDAVKGAVVFQKLWVSDDDPNAKDPAKKRDKALKMLATIDANAGGKLAANGSAPTNESLAVALTSKLMAITCKIWDMNGNTGNWVAAVSPKNKELKLTGDVVRETTTASAGNKFNDLDDDIPFD